MQSHETARTYNILNIGITKKMVPAKMYRNRDITFNKTIADLVQILSILNINFFISLIAPIVPLEYLARLIRFLGKTALKMRRVMI